MQAAYELDRWVSVEEIPKKAGLYLVLLTDGKYSIVEVYEGIDGLQFNPHYSITKWQPLPKPSQQ